MKTIGITIDEDVYEKLCQIKPEDCSIDDFIRTVLIQKSKKKVARPRVRNIEGYNVSKYSLELVKQVVEDYNNGLSTITIAEKHGMWQKTIWRIINRNRHKITRWK